MTASGWCVLSVSLILGTANVAADNSAAEFVSENVFAAWSKLRTADCARCHGSNLDGLAAPSVVEFARTQTRERVQETILKGNPGRGMPAYESVGPVRERIDAIYEYLRGRADGSIPAGKLKAKP